MEAFQKKIIQLKKQYEPLEKELNEQVKKTEELTNKYKNECVSKIGQLQGVFK